MTAVTANGRDDERVKVGTAWRAWGYVIDIIDERPGYVIHTPDGPQREREVAHLFRPRHEGQTVPKKPKWVAAWRVGRYGEPLADGEEVTVQARTAAERAVVRARAQAEKDSKKAAKKAALTPERRMRNRITSARYKLAHPEKYGRTEWTDLEKADIENTMREAEAEIEKLRRAS